MGLTNSRQVNIPKLWELELRIQLLEKYAVKLKDISYYSEKTILLNQYNLSTGHIVITDFRTGKQEEIYENSYVQGGLDSR